jgi:hypothetical protein
VAIDRTSKFAFARLVESAGKIEAAQFLRDLIKAVPYRIHTVLTDNGVQFTPRKQDIWDSAHIFDRVCEQHNIEHRLTQVNHPWTTDVIDKSFFASTGVFSSRARVTLWQRAGLEVQILPRSVYRRSSFRAPARTFPDLGPRGLQPATSRV